MTSTKGAVLPLVLMALLVVAAAAFAMSFRVTLDSMAARSAMSATMARAQAAGALALGVAELQAAVAVGTEVLASYGPWSEYGVEGTLSVAVAGVVTAPEPGPPPVPPLDPDAPPAPDAYVPVYVLVA